VDSPAFDQLALELFAQQFEQNAPYRRFCEARGVCPQTVSHWTAIPAVPTSAFKVLELSCLPAAGRTTVFHSSGTTGHQPSRHFHSAASLVLYEASVLAWFNPHFQLATGNWQLAILAPPPALAPRSSLAHMFETIRRELAPGAAPYLGKVANDGAWWLELEVALRRLRRAAAAEWPLLILGTAFAFVHLLDHLAELDLRLELPPGSCAMETGGYKGRSRALPQPDLHALITQRLGIPAHQIICEYGMSELSSQAYDNALVPSHAPLHAPRNTPSAQRLFRFPPWARVRIVSPETGAEVGEGETGLIRVFDLANVYSVMAIQTEDLGIRHGDGFALAGRAATAEPRGCSLLAV